MILTRTPFRISFFGGGTDYPVWYEEHGGIVLSTTINKYCYVVLRYLPPFFDHKYRIRYMVTEETQTIDAIKHPSVRECLRYVDVGFGVEMVHTSDIPARSGVGSSSAFTVGLLNGLYALTGKMVTKRQLAREAIRIEQDVLRENVGSQDQVAVAFGGLNKIEFGGQRNFFVSPITIPAARLQSLEVHMMLFYTGFARTANDIAGEQIRKTSQIKSQLLEMNAIAHTALNALNSELEDISEIGRLLHATWEIKRGLTTRISNGEIDSLYTRALRAGALGGKLLGAGGGGFLLLFVEPEKQEGVKEELNELLYVPFAFEDLGSQVTLYSKQDVY